MFVADATSNALSGYTTSTAPLAALNDSLFTTGNSPCSVAVAPLDNFVYVDNKAS